MMFLREFIRHRKQIGAIAPSSRFLVDKMIHSVELESAKVVVELGAGTGVMTHKILSRISHKTVLLVFETNQHFYNRLKADILDERVILIHDSAEKIQEYLHYYQLAQVDVVISSLPLMSIAEDTKQRIVKKVYEVLATKGVFVQFQYSFFMFYKFKLLFRKVNVAFESLNVPPAFVFSCTK
jgi:phospholipid N-methyltransferase